MINNELEQNLNDAFKLAHTQKHEFVTVVVPKTGSQSFRETFNPESIKTTIDIKILKKFN